MANYDVKELRNVELPAPLCFQLADIIKAYDRTYDFTPTKKDLDPTDYIPKESPCSMENLKDTVKGIQGQDLAWLEMKRAYNKKWSGYRTWYNL